MRDQASSVRFPNSIPASSSPRCASIAGVAVFALLAVAAEGEQPHGILAKGSFAVGVNFPGVGIRVVPSKGYLVEGRGQFAEGIVIVSARVCKYYSSVSGVMPYIGGEVGRVTYTVRGTTGSGMVLQAVAGGEYFVRRRASIQLDAGPTYFGVSQLGGASMSGVEWVVDVGLNYYLSWGVDETRRLERARECYLRGEYRKALKRARSLLRRQLDNWRAWALLGNCHYRQGDVLEALWSYKQALRFNPDNEELRLWMEKVRAGDE